MYYIFMMSFIMGLLSFCLKRKYLLVMLLSLEFVVISMFLGIFNFMGLFNWEFFFSLIFLTMCVCEGAIGLALVVLLIRVYGDNYFQSFSLLW
uniref:NADH-ubiquinone oxidoreductase chain 4L n=1 Tax=Cyclommatus strigiceps vitalisi TaxID=618761 RepID=A0A5H2EF66_9SCAR|nr:NADH dehydrogenase subunit 4L [Cyclommatus strigiceps vitalisi]ASF90509.1 NADH dehydrogenase subunit 4L [Cyclommatus strigiceps vitalisi]